MIPYQLVAIVAGAFICGFVVGGYVMRATLIGSSYEITSDEEVTEAFRVLEQRSHE